MSARLGAEHYGEERTEMAAAMAEQIIADELKRRRWQETELKARPKGDPAKVALAARLGHLNHLLYRRRKAREE